MSQASHTESISGRRGAPSSWRVEVLLDWFYLLFSPAAAFVIQEFFLSASPQMSDSAVYLMVNSIVTSAAFLVFKVPNRLWVYTSLADVSVIAVTVAFSILVTNFLVLQISPDTGISPTLPFLHFAILTTSLVGSRILVRCLRSSTTIAGRRGGQSDEHTVPDGHVPDHVILVGVNIVTELYLRAVPELARARVEVVGIVDEDPSTHGCQIRSHEILGAPRDLFHILQDLSVRAIDVTEIIVCCPWSALSSESRDVLNALETSRGVNLVPLHSGYCFGLIKTGQEEFLRNSFVSDYSSTRIHGQFHRFIHSKDTRSTGLSGYFKVKRWLDITATLGLTITFFPLILLVWLLVATSIGVPCIFWQKRPGYRGSVFKIYKFRTMLSPCDPDGNRIPDEQRQTRVGLLLRALRFDELPQLYNVLIGDMSLVGPRPLLPEDQPRREPLRELMRPGVTGWAQVNGGKLLSPNEKLALDLWYARHASLWLDLKICFLSLIAASGGDRINPQAVSQAVNDMNAYHSPSNDAEQSVSHSGIARMPPMQSASTNGRAPLYIGAGIQR